MLNGAIPLTKEGGSIDLKFIESIVVPNGFSTCSISEILSWNLQLCWSLRLQDHHVVNQWLSY